MPVPAPDLAALRLLGDRVRPASRAGERILPVPAALAPLLPQGGLPRGATVATAGSAASSLALALSGPVTTAGSWIGVVGLPQLGLLAAAELGVDLERVLLVADPAPEHWPTTVAALLDAVELVLVRPPRSVGVSVQRRLTARARDRGSVLLQVGGDVGAWAHAPDLTVSGATTVWSGLGPGHGHLQARQVEVVVGGRRGADRGRRVRLWLPGVDGRIAAVAAAPAERPGSSPASRSADVALREVG